MQRKSIKYRISHIVCFTILFLLTTFAAADQKSNKPREQVGTVLGRPVYRDEIRTESNLPLSGELHRLFSAPVLQKYQQTHQSKFALTRQETETAARYFTRNEKIRELYQNSAPRVRKKLEKIKQMLAAPDLKPEDKQKLLKRQAELQMDLEIPGSPFARFALKQWKFQKHLYDQYGGGRILWQQAGLEAFDAMHNWLKAQEKQGKFQITDPELRKAFYEYWTTHNHGAFLTDDPERIRKEFLEPEWALKPVTKKKPAEK